MLDALAHVIVTEGLVERGLRARALRLATSFEEWAAFVAEPRNSPEAIGSRHRRARPATLRGAARLYATGGNGAIYYGLGVTEHSQGSTDGDGASPTSPWPPATSAATASA